MELQKNSNLAPQKQAFHQKSWVWIVSFLLFAMTSGLAFTADAFGQTGSAKITGTVVFAETQETIIGANIFIKGTTTGTVSDFDGKYSIEAKIGDVLVFSFVGTKSQEHLVTGSTVLNVKLTADALMLDEFVVVGYGLQKKSDVSGSVSTVNMDDLSKTKAADPIQSLQGLASGVTVTNVSGEPGTEATINIRGVTTLGENQPLVLIDGVPGSLSNLSQEEIESISILKDAAASAIYGTKAAGGVILVQTKRGERDKDFKVSYSMNYTLQSVDHFYEVADAAEYKEIYSMVASTDPSKTSAEAILLAEQNGLPIGEFNGIRFAADDYAFNYDRKENGVPVYANVNWQDEMFRNTGAQQHSILITGGGKNSNMSLSGNYTDQKGTLIGSGFKKGGFRFTSDLTKNWLKLGQSISYTKRDGSSFNSVGYGQMYDVISAIPHVQIYNPNNDGGYGGYINDMPEGIRANPVARALLPNTDFSNEYLSVNGNAEVTFTKNLKYKFNLGFQSDNLYNFNFTPTYYVSPQDFSDQNYLNETRTRSTEWIAENLLTYSKLFGSRHQVDALLGYSAEQNKFRLLGAKGEDIPYNELPVLDLATQLKEVASNGLEKTMASTFGRINYSLDGKYHLQTSFRRDGSSNFGSENKYGFFPSVSLAWNISQESFFNIPLISDLKLRASYGQLGNDRIPSYLYIQGITSGFFYVNGMNELVTGMTGFNLANKDIKWETTTTSNFGLDLRMWNDRLLFTADYFQKTTKDILVEVNLPLSYGGATSQIMNAATVDNNGFELSAEWREKIGDFKYSIGGNFTTYKNKVVSLGTRTEPIWGTDVDWNSGSVTRTAIGESISEFYVWKTNGIFQNQAEIDEWNKQGATDESGNFSPLQPNAAPGDLRFVDVDGNGVLDDKDRTHAGSPIPDFTYSLNLRLEYKGFDMYALFYGVQGNEIFNGLKYRSERLDNYWNYSKDALNAWTPQNTNTNIPRATREDLNGNRRVSDRFIEDGSYLRLRTLQLGYTLPQSALSFLHFDKVRVYVGGNNLFTATSYSGYDPEVFGDDVLNRGVDWGRYPLFKSFIFGLDLTF